MKRSMYWNYATQSLLRGGQRTILAIFCVAVGVLAIVALQLVSNAVNAGFTSDIRTLNGGDLAITNTTAPLTTAQLGIFDQLQARGTITGYAAVLTDFGTIEQGTNTVSFQALEVDPTQFPLEGTPVFTTPAGGQLQTLVQGTSVVITSALADNSGAKVGDSMAISTGDGRAETVTVAGIIQSTGYFKSALLLVNRTAYQSLPSTTGQVAGANTIYVDVPGHTDAASADLARQLQQQFPLISTQTTQQLLATNGKQVQMIHDFLQVVGLLALLIGGVGIVNTMQVLLRRRRIEIAMLKTMGFRRRDLYAMFALETGLIGLAGGVIGAGAGVGVSFLVRGLLEQTLQSTLPTTIDPLTVLAGLAVGIMTTVIFGLLPIVQASQIRPLSVLRESAEGATVQSRLVVAGMLLLLAGVFCLLAVLILGDTTVAISFIGGLVVFLAVLTGIMLVAVWVISRFPVGWLPRSAKANARLALGNIGRQRSRTVMTLLALFIGVFAIGMIVVLGQNIKTALSQFITNGIGINAEIVTGPQQHDNVAAQLAQVPGVTHLTDVSIASTSPSAINDQPIAAVIQSATAGGATVAAVTDPFTGVQGYDLTRGALPDPLDVPLVAGAQDAQPGRLLQASDAGTLNALLPYSASQAPDNLKIGATVTITSQADAVPLTLTIVGFYKIALPELRPMLVDAGVVSTLSMGHPAYGLRMHLNPSTAAATLAQIQQNNPGVTTFSIANLIDQFALQLNSLIVVLETVASLALLASVIIIANTVALAMLERRREIGILKAVGFTSRRMLSEVLLENGIVSLLGSMLAMVTVITAAAALGSAVFNLPINVPVLTVLGIIAATAFVCMVIAATVAWGATRLRPVAVLRYE